jgi:hypothetical protein
MDGLMSWNHLICVCRDPEFQIVFPSPRATKNGVSSDVAPVMAKLAPRWNDALCALDGGSSGSPSSCAARRFAIRIRTISCDDRRGDQASDETVKFQCERKAYR